jgi:hypothetical protein
MDGSTEVAVLVSEVKKVDRRAERVRRGGWIGALVGGITMGALTMPQDDFQGSAKVVFTAGAAVVGYLVGRQFDRAAGWVPVVACQ